MMQTISESFPQGTRFTRPEGGYVLWVELPAKVNALKLYRLALHHHISSAPGILFSAQRGYPNCIRINYSYPWTPEYAQAVKQLGQLATSLS